MIRIEWLTAEPAALEAACVLATSLDAIGLPARICRDSLPAELSLRTKYDLVRVLSEPRVEARDRMFILLGDKPDDARMVGLRRAGVASDVPHVAAGHFATLQAEITARSRLGYILGREPELFRLPAEGTELLACHHAPVFGVERPRPVRTEGPLRVLVIAPDIGADGSATALRSLCTSRKLQVTILTDGKSKTAIRAAGLPAPVYHYSEVPLATFALRHDAAVFCQPVPQIYALRMMLADFAVSGIGLLDASAGFANRRLEPAFVPAPSDPAALAAFLVNEILPDAGDLEPLSKGSTLAARSHQTVAALRSALGTPAARTRPAIGARKGRTPGSSVPRIAFLPTNGVGLGHAQRCSIIAGEIPRRAARSVFAAFPSCMRLLQTYGFDVMPLVQKSAMHADALANDLVNYRRLDRLVSDADAFVFDGGYVFDSIFRTLFDRRVPSIWIRRGLWQAEQDNSVALEREKVFDRVIVPLEAFDELNVDYSGGAHIVKVGPIVQRVALSPGDRDSLRAGLAERFAIPFKQLVVTMLGGGVAADRSSQTIAAAASLARRPDVLNLVVVWPTASVDPGLFSWPNTRIVRTHHASVLAAAADVYISAAGYNSFHEAMYNRIPTVFIPQMAPYMDDQRTRAAAAADRGLAHIVEPHQLMTLDQTVMRMLDGEGEEIRARLGSESLPEPGAAAAAAAITALAGIASRPWRRERERRIA